MEDHSGSLPPFSEDTFRVNIDGQVKKELEFTIKELADMFPRKSVVAAGEGYFKPFECPN